MHVHAPVYLAGEFAVSTPNEMHIHLTTITSFSTTYNIKKKHREHTHKLSLFV